VKPSTHTLFKVRSKTSSLLSDFGKFRLLCSGSCVLRNQKFRVRLDGALSNLIELKMSLLIAGGGGLDDL